PVRAHLREFAHDERLDVRPRCLFIVQICPDISDVRIRQANDLACVGWIGKNFLVSRKAGVENDFPAPARDGAGSAAVKDAPVFERKCGVSVLDFRQCVLPGSSSYTNSRDSLVVVGLAALGGPPTQHHRQRSVRPTPTGASYTSTFSFPMHVR